MDKTAAFVSTPGMADPEKQDAPAPPDLSGEFAKASAEVVRLRRELADAEAIRDALLARMLAPGASPASLHPGPRTVVVQSDYQAFLLRIREIPPPFSRADVFDLLKTPSRTLTTYLAQALLDGVLRRLSRGRYDFAR